MTLRFSSLKELRKALSPDVEIVDDGKPTPEGQTFRKEASNRKILEELFLRNWLYLGGPPLVREYRFHPTRKWRLDFALPPFRLGFEIQGGLYSAKSGHRSQEGVRRDYEKDNAAKELGWLVWSLTSQNIQDAPFLESLILHVRGRMEGGPHCHQ